MGTEFLYENNYDMIDAAADEHLDCEEDIFFDTHEDEVNDAAIDALITPEDEEKAMAAIAIEDAYEKSSEDEEEEEELEEPEDENEEE